MFEFSYQQRQKALIWLSFFHILVIASSNYLVQVPFTLFGFNTTWGAFTFPFIFLTTDLTVRVFGAPLARRIIFYVMMPALLISYLISVLFYHTSWSGFAALLQFNTVVGRIALASFLAYVLGQVLDIYVFNGLRQRRAWWIAPVVSSIFGNALDTLAFFFTAFYRSSDAFMAANWMEIACVDYGFKMLICTLFFLPAYGLLLNFLLKRLVSIKSVSEIESISAAA